MEDKLNNEKRLATMEQKIDNLKEDICDVKNDIKGIAKDINDHVKWEAEKYDKLDGKFSGKWVEKTLLVMMGIAATGIIGAIFKMIFK